MPATAGVFAGTVFTSIAATVSQPINTTQDWVGIMLTVTEVTGTDAAVVFRIQWSMDGGTWADAQPGDTFEPITKPCAVVKRFPVKAMYWRAVVEVSGNGATFTGTANAYV